MHGFSAEKKRINEETLSAILEHVLEHVMVCSDCKLWARNDLCPKVKEKQDKGELKEEIYMFHGMLHGDRVVGGDCIAYV